ncbi:MAG: prepilin-type N-terminal cleavage/methylation domain-containing protein [Armatimonadota bacterium]|nr:DUF1559 domain-containing protein [bacterium]
MPARRKSGFTLIELLVVIAIIAILAAILFPVFARAREAARKSNCQSNMKECAIALQVYWGDYDATLPSSAIASTTALNDVSDSLTKTFMSGIGKLPTPPNELPQTWVQVLYSHMKSKDIMFCPSDGVEHNPPANSEYNLTTYPCSYWWKYATELAWFRGCKKEGNFAYNSDCIIFYEHAGFHAGDTTGLKNGVQINVAYLDTHVKNVTLKNSQATSSTATNPVASGEPMYYNYDFENNAYVPDATNPATGFNPAVQGDKL